MDISYTIPNRLLPKNPIPHQELVHFIKFRLDKLVTSLGEQDGLDTVAVAIKTGRILEIKEMLKWAESFSG